MDHIKLSIIIPVYNVSRYLRKCLDSVVNQTLKEIEIICINDGSTDDSLSILEEYAAHDERIVVINKENKKQGAARNAALAIARGTYVGFVDSDDWIDTSMFSELYNKAKETCADIVLTESYVVDEEANHARKNNKLDIFPPVFDHGIFNFADTLAFLFEVSFSPCDKLYKATFLKNVNAKFEENLFFEDIIFWATTYISADKISLLRKPLYFYRQNRYSTTHSKNEKYFDIIKILALLEEKLRCFNVLDDLKHQFIGFKIKMLASHLRRIDKAYKATFYKLIRQDLKNADERFYDTMALKKGGCYLRYNLIKRCDNYILFRFFDLATRLFYISNAKNFLTLKIFFKFKIKKDGWFNMGTLGKTPVFYYRAETNFGDVLNVEILSKLFHKELRYAKPYSAKLIAIGSILDFFLTNKNKRRNKSELIVWGSGFIKPPEPSMHLNRNLKILALRGKLTKNAIEEKLHSSLDQVILGDPGLLASYLIDKESIQKKYKLGIIPHYVDKQNSLLHQLVKSIKHARIIDIQGDPYSVLRDISECEVIISSSLHGLIAADSLGIPNQWVVFSDKIFGGEYKYRDYYSAYDMGSDVKPINLKEVPFHKGSLHSIKIDYSVPYTKVKEIQRSLVKAYLNA